MTSCAVHGYEKNPRQSISINAFETKKIPETRIFFAVYVFHCQILNGALYLDWEYFEYAKHILKYTSKKIDNLGCWGSPLELRLFL